MRPILLVGFKKRFLNCLLVVFSTSIPFLFCLVRMPSYSLRHCFPLYSLVCFYNLVDLIISIANIFIFPNYIVTLLCNSEFVA